MLISGEESASVTPNSSREIVTASGGRDEENEQSAPVVLPAMGGATIRDAEAVGLVSGLDAGGQIDDARILAGNPSGDLADGHVPIPASGGNPGGAGLDGDDFGADSVGSANVGKSDSANVKKTPELIAYDPFANVGITTRKVLPMPTLANRSQVLNLNVLQWARPTGKPPHPKGFYWQASGSKTKAVDGQKKRILVGWTLVKNGKCQGCQQRYRPPVVYLKGESWDSLKGENLERQKTEIRLLLGKCQRRLNDLRCPECLPRDDGKMRIVGKTN